MQGQPRNHSLQATDLANEAYVKLRMGDDGDYDWRDRGRFLKAAAQAMRWILIDHARASRSQRREEGEPSAMERVLITYEDRTIDLLALNDALEKLAAEDPPMAQVVELHFFAHLPMDEVARVLDIPKSTLEKYWRVTRARLLKQLS